MTTRTRAALVAALVGLSVVQTAPAGGASYSLDRRIRDDAVRESSGLARSTYDRPILWTHNDSGDGPRLFAVGSTGGTRAVVRLGNASARDWEDIAAGPNHTLWVGDIGDNGSSRSHITVYRIREPRALSDGTVRATAFDLTYPGGPRDAEALLVRPDTGRVFVVSKGRSGGAIYRAPARLSTDRPNRMTRVAGAPAMVTAGSFAPGGRRFVLSTYTACYRYARVGARARRFEKPSTQQGESLTVSRSGRVVFVGSEGYDSPVYRVPIPR